MKGLVVVTHTILAEALLQAAEMILGSLKNAAAVCLEKEDSLETMNRKLTTAIETVGRDGDGVVVMTDMFGGTPSNISLVFLAEGQVEILTGVNLPMILSFFNAKPDMALTDLATSLSKAAKEGIVLPSALLAE
ncbi:MAG: PTS sugar transporter [Deltaproteobacteria bacterium]|nr:PTS sugar transporter [Deltaproteobacteria bacterium]